MSLSSPNLFEAPLSLGVYINRTGHSRSLTTSCRSFAGTQCGFGTQIDLETLHGTLIKTDQPAAWGI